jgi:hypothetical protein
MTQISTPRGEEAERLDFWYNRADELYWMAIANQLLDGEYIRRATELDEQGVGEYYRALCNWDMFPNGPHPRLALHPFLLGTLPVRLPAPASQAGKRLQNPGWRRKGRAGPRT